MSFARFGRADASSHRDDANTNTNTSDAKQKLNIQELVNPVTQAEEQDMIETIRHYFNKHTGTSTCHMCGNHIDSHKNSRVETSITYQGKRTLTLVFHAGCTPLLWQTVLQQVARKQKYPVCRGTEDDDDIATQVAHTVSPLLQ